VVLVLAFLVVSGEFDLDLHVDADVGSCYRWTLDEGGQKWWWTRQRSTRHARVSVGRCLAVCATPDCGGPSSSLSPGSGYCPDRTNGWVLVSAPSSFRR